MAKTDWRILNEEIAEDALTSFQEILWHHLIKFIPRRMIREMKRSHPWLNERAKEAIMRKNNAEGTPSYSEKREEYARILAEERKKYIQRMKEKLQDLPKKSKKW